MIEETEITPFTFDFNVFKSDVREFVVSPNITFPVSSTDKGFLANTEIFVTSFEP